MRMDRNLQLQQVAKKRDTVVLEIEDKLKNFIKIIESATEGNRIHKKISYSILFFFGTSIFDNDSLVLKDVSSRALFSVSLCSWMKQTSSIWNFVFIGSEFWNRSDDLTIILGSLSTLRSCWVSLLSKPLTNHERLFSKENLPRPQREGIFILRVGEVVNLPNHSKNKEKQPPLDQKRKSWYFIEINVNITIDWAWIYDKAIHHYSTK